MMSNLVQLGTQQNSLLAPFVETISVESESVTPVGIPTIDHGSGSGTD